MLGRLSAADAGALAAARRGNAPAMALLVVPPSLGVPDEVPEDTARAAQILSAGGWRVAVAGAGTPLAAAWQQLHRPIDRPLPVGGLEVGLDSGLDGGLT